jgi:release factor glutamine methyltransferase
MNAKDLFDKLVLSITIPEPADEIQSMALLVLEKMYGITRTDILAQKDNNYHVSVELTEIIKRLNMHEPVQYVLGEAYFMNRRFLVNKHVLIPRPETEQLVMMVKEEYKNKENIRLLDVGTGSGCIAISLAKELAHSTVFAIDISTEALTVAKQNAELLSALVHIELLDILHNPIPFDKLSCIVSNPPYIMHREKSSMNANVLQHEPHLALFVPDEDPLLFYRAIAKQATKILEPAGKIFVEINEALAEGVCTVFKEYGFSTNQIVKDIFDKDRIVIARLAS